MKRDPFGILLDVDRDPASVGTKRADWIKHADFLRGVAALQRDMIHKLNAEIVLLKKQIAKRRPKGGRPPIDNEKVKRIEAELAAGHSKRSIADRHRVSAMTVVRIANRVAERDALAQAES